jgi:hypothetical protein
MLPGVVCAKLLRLSAKDKVATKTIGRGVRFISDSCSGWYRTKPNVFRTRATPGYHPCRKCDLGHGRRLACICRGWNGQPAEPHGQLTGLQIPLGYRTLLSRMAFTIVHRLKFEFSFGHSERSSRYCLCERLRAN